MILSLKKLGNGFRARERKLGNSELGLSIEILKDGISVLNEDFGNGLSRDEVEKIIAHYLATQMNIYGVEEETTSEERVRLAQKAMTLNIINGYKIQPLIDGDYSNIRVELLENGRCPVYTTGMYNLTKEDLQKLQEKLNNIMRDQLDIRNQIRPLYVLEIIQLIAQVNNK